MTGSAILDVMIAMAVLYFALSMVCSAVNNTLSRLFSMKERNFDSVVRSLFLNARDGNNQLLFDRLMKHPLVQTLNLQAERNESGWIRAIREWLGSRWQRLRAAMRVLSGAAAPAANPGPAGQSPFLELAPITSLNSIPTPIFVQALIDIVRPPDWDSTEPIDFERFVRMIALMKPDQAGPFKEVLQGLADDPEKKIANVRAKLGGWFESICAQSSEWYESTMRRTSLIVALVLCVSFNIDSLAIADRFYVDSTVRMVYVNQGNQLAQTDLKDAKKVLASTKDVLNFLNQSDESTFNLPVGWYVASDGGSWWIQIGNQLKNFAKWIGFLVTAFALSCGAPFWHDILQRLVNQKKSTDPSAPEPTPS